MSTRRYSSLELFADARCLRERADSFRLAGYHASADVMEEKAQRIYRAAFEAAAAEAEFASVAALRERGLL